jgi:adenylate kinase family enzyme
MIASGASKARAIPIDSMPILCPGSGKSTIARSIAGFVHLEADMYFETSNGYSFNPGKPKDAHVWCFAETSSALGRGLSVVVANTFMTLSEMERYFFFGYPTTVGEARGNFFNVHQVDAAVLQRMRDSWEPIEPRQSTVPTIHWGQ